MKEVESLEKIGRVSFMVQYKNVRGGKFLCNKTNNVVYIILPSLTFALGAITVAVVLCG